MEEKDLQAGEPATEISALPSETHSTDEQPTAVNMQAAENVQAEPSQTAPPSASSAGPSARERLKGAVLDQGQVKASGFMRRGGLFEEYEITNAKEMPFFMRVFAASALLHLVIFAVAMQLPTMVERSCESTEFTQRLCDTMYVASLYQPRDMIEQPYDPTQIPDALNGGEITFVTTDSFPYPEGYWTLRDELEGRLPEDAAATPDPNVFGTVNGTGSSPSLDLSAPPSLPGNGSITGGAIQPPVITSTGPAPPFMGGGTRVKAPKNSNANTAIPGINTPPNGNTNAVAQNTNKTPAAPLPEGSYNKVPLYDFRDKLVEWREASQNNFYQQFQYSIAGTIDKEGKLTVDGKPNFVGDPKMEEIIKLAVASFSDSGMMKLLNDLQSKAVKITFAQDGNQFLVRLETAQGTEKEAKSLYSGLNVALEIGKTLVKNGADEEADPVNKQKELTTLELMKMAQLKREGNIIIIDTMVPNKFAEDMYQTYKKDLEEKKSNPQGVAINSNTNSGIAK
ncbi:MAG TPA: hypothetical protein VGO50_00285 [Pyrinomonadaceae bacterium]|jgi:hypothetical protein|nr:hypothetical protein [Pyrinomonadaceae bacterium]